MFEDWIQSGEDWLRSSLVLSMSKTSSQRRRGKHVLLPFHEIKKKFGPAIGSQIYQDKKALEQSKPQNDSTIYFMPHPEAPTQEDICLHIFFLAKGIVILPQIQDFQRTWGNGVFSL